MVKPLQASRRLDETGRTEIILLTEPRSEQCGRAKEILHYLSAEFELSVTEVPLASDEGRSLAIEHAILTAPGLLVDGVLFSYGKVDENRLRMTLASIRPIGG
jgi:hypothetical protein